MPSRFFGLLQFRTTVRRKEITMITALALLGACAAARGAYALYTAWRLLPRRNEDLVLF